MNNESASFVRKPPPYRVFLCNHIRTNLRVPTVLTVPRVPIALTVPTVPTALTASITPLLLLLLLLLRHQEGQLYWFASPKGVTQGSPVSSVQVSSVQFRFSASQFKSLSQIRRSTSSSSSQPVEVTQWKSSSRSLFIRSFG